MSRKQVAFDLDTHELKKYYPTDNWRNAYEDIKNHMTMNGFQWQQGSVYVSEESLSKDNTVLIIEKLVNNNPWLNKCMRDCRLTSIGRQNDLTVLFDKNADVPLREENSNQKKHIKDIKECGYYPTKKIMNIMDKLDCERGCFTDMETISRIHNGEQVAESDSVAKCSHELGEIFKQQRIPIEET